MPVAKPMTPAPMMRTRVSSCCGVLTAGASCGGTENHVRGGQRLLQDGEIGPPITQKHRTCCRQKARAARCRLNLVRVAADDPYQG